jgi:hypothetical protein
VFLRSERRILRSPAEPGNRNAQGFPGHDAARIRNFSGAMDECLQPSRALGRDESRALYAEGRPQPEVDARH